MKFFYSSHISPYCPGNSYGWRSTDLFYKKDQKLSRLRLAGVPAVDVYVTGRFVKHSAGVNRFSLSALHLRDNASVQNVGEYIRIVSVRRHDLARGDKNHFDESLFPR